MQGIKDNPNLPLIITVVFTALLMIIGIIVLSKTEKKSVIGGEKEERLVREDSNFIGPPDAKVTLVEFSDFQCPACSRVYPETKKVEENYSDRVRFVYRHYPLRSIHPLSQLAAEASEAAAAQGKFWEYHDKLFESQVEWSELNHDDAIIKFTEYAQEVEVSDIAKFREELGNGTYTNKVNRDKDDAEALNLPGTPTVFINGEQIESPTYENLTLKIDQLLNQ